MKRHGLLAKKTASALVITLSCLVILSIIVVAFLSQAVLNRQLAFTSSGQVRAQVLAETATDLIVNDLRSEITAGSDTFGSGSNTIYFPRTNSAAVPFRNVDATLTNLIRVSRAGSALWSGPAYTASGPIRSSQQVSTTNVSANSRYVKADRWNRPLLLGTNLPAAFASPDWFLITRGGLFTGAEPALTNLINRSPANSNMVVGRFAYAIYDEGGLLDINVAGNALSTTENARRGRLHQADLTRIPGVLDAPSLVAWRNASTSTDGVWLNSPTNSFLTVKPGDQRFISRLDLIKYAQQFPAVLSPEALGYLGTFTREKNAPTFRPSTVTAANPNIASIVRADGKPLMPRRFSLSNLDLVRFDAPTANVSKIYDKFGLSRANADDPWVYNHGDPAKILTLAEVATLNRDPDFFEILKAAILEGSLGKTAGSPSLASSDTAFRTAHLDVLSDLQIIRIGANLIDQYDADSWPTSISFQTPFPLNTVEVSSGIENLPYINRMFDTPFRPAANTSELSTWYEFEMWNPHQNPSSSIAQGPQTFRITATAGQAYAAVDRSGGESVTGPVTTFSAGSRWIQFPLQSFGEPTLLASGNSSCDAPPPAPDNNRIVGLKVGSVDVSTVVETGTWSGGAFIQPDAAGNMPAFELQYRSPNNTWITYQRTPNLRDTNRPGGTLAGNSFFKTLSSTHGGYYFRGDPRNIRFGGGKNGGTAPGATMRGVDGNNPYPFKQSDGRYTSDGPSSLSVNWTLLRVQNGGLPAHARLTALANNDSDSSTSYRDPDGILRVADGGLRGAAENPLANGATAPRPVILNRPFRNAADMGYAFRDLPWKTLDFFTKNSADAAMLDVFSLDEEDVVAGKVNLNTRQPKVLEALVAGSIRSENAASQAITSAEAATIASDLVAFSTNSPMVNKADVVRAFSPATVSVAWPAIKTEREAAVRALAGPGNIRTWNLLIDLIVQVGRYPISAKSYADFTVEGERRYWLHLALDRYTGEIVDQQLEAVNE